MATSSTSRSLGSLPSSVKTTSCKKLVHTMRFDPWFNYRAAEYLAENGLSHPQTRRAAAGSGEQAPAAAPACRAGRSSSNGMTTNPGIHSAGQSAQRRSPKHPLDSAGSAICSCKCARLLQLAIPERIGHSVQPQSHALGGLHESYAQRACVSMCISQVAGAYLPLDRTYFVTSC